MHDLEIIDDDQFHAMHLHHAPGFGPELRRVDCRCVVDVDGCATEVFGGFNQFRDVAFGRDTIGEVTPVHARAGAEHAQHQHVRRHLEAEDSDWRSFYHSHVVDNVYRQGG